MPIYEYHCEPCDHTFETLIRSAGDLAHCPRCGSLEVAKQLSVPAAAQTGRTQLANDTSRNHSYVRAPGGWDPGSEISVPLKIIRDSSGKFTQ